MDEVTLRDWQPEDDAAILALNAASVSMLSPMDAARFAGLRAMCSVLIIAEMHGRAIGFLMAFEDGTAYDSENYRWFAARFKRFLYIDRVVVAESCRGLGVGRLFYAAAERRAVNLGLAWLAAEVDIQPPNAGSLAFHDRLGFVEVGQQVYGAAGKAVSLRVRGIDAAANR